MPIDPEDWLPEDEADWYMYEDDYPYDYGDDKYDLDTNYDLSEQY